MHGFSTALQDLEARRRVDRRALGFGLALSLLLHVLLLGVPLPAATAPEAEAGPASPDRFGTRLLRLPPADAETPERLRPPPAIPDPVWSPARAPTRPRSHEAPPPPTTPTASARLRAGALDARLTPAPAAPAAPTDLARGRIAAGLASAAPTGPSTLALRNAALVSTWGEPTGGSALQPGRIVLDGHTLPFCGGTDPARCGFGALPWDLEAADRWTEYFQGLDAQIRWLDRGERAEAIRTRSLGPRDTLDVR